jgi:hypothetical protein
MECTKYFNFAKELLRQALNAKSEYEQISWWKFKKRNAAKRKFKIAMRVFNKFNNLKEKS